MKKNILLFLITIALTIFLTGAIAFAADDSGKCGGNLEWSLNGSELTISGTGDMYNYEQEDGAPWFSYSATIKSFVIEEGVTSIGTNAFRNCEATSTLILPQSLKEIGKNAFSASNFDKIIIADSVEEIGTSAFWQSNSPTVYTLKDCPAYNYFSTASNFMEGTPDVRVIYEEPEDTYVNFTTDSINVRTDTEIELSELLATSSNVTLSDLTISSSNDNIVSVIDNSLLYASAVPGNSATITASFKDEDKNIDISTKLTVNIISENIDNATGITLEEGDTQKSSVTLNINEVNKLKYEINTAEGKSALYEKVVWSTSDKTVATVTNGVIKGISEGTATVTATLGDSISASCNVTIENKARKIIKLPIEGLYSMNKGETKRISCYVYPSNASNRDKLTYSTDSNLLEVSPDGTVKALGANKSNPPTVKVTVDSLVQEIPINVIAELKGISIYKKNGDNWVPATSAKGLFVDDTVNLKVVYDPEDTTDDRTIEWTSRNPSIASVVSTGENTAKVTILQGKSTVITAKVGDAEATCRIIAKSYVPLEDPYITLNKTSCDVEYGSTETIKLTYSPTYATPSETVWTSDAEEGVIKLTTNEDDYNIAYVKVEKVVSQPITVTATVVDHDPTGTVEDKTYTATCTVNTKKATPEIEVPTGLETTCGKTLGDINLSKYTTSKGTEGVPGTFAWENTGYEVGNAPDDGPSVEKTATAGGDKFTLKFTPTDTNNYNVVSGIGARNAEDKVAVTVKHDLTEIAKKKATFEEIGNHAYYQCAGCAVCFKEETCKTKTTATDEEIAALVIPEIADVEYTGADQEPAVTIKDTNNKELVQGADKDYTVSYSNNKDVWIEGCDTTKKPTATITFNEKGNYAASAESQKKDINFIINGKDISGATVTDIPVQTYTGSAIEPTVTVTDGEVLTLGTHYTVKYENNTKAGTAKAIITGKGIYTGSVTKEFTISPAEVDPDTKITITIAEQTYTGSEIKPTPEVICDGKTLDADDYTVTYVNNVNVSNGEGDNAPVATVKLKGNYVEKTKTKKFVINARSITADEISVADITAQTYTGSAIDPGVTVTDSIRATGEQTLTNNDYEVTYNNTNINAGTATATIAGKGNYTGTTTKDFTINPKNIGEVTATIGAKTYSGIAFTPEPTVTYGSKNLVKDTDFEITGYADNTNAGEASVTIKGKANYTGTKTVKFTINPKSIKGVTIADIDDQTYDGQAKTPEPAVKDGETPLVKGTDFTYSYDKNTDAGTAKVIVTGKGNYSTETTESKEFTINPKSISGMLQDLATASYSFTGADIIPDVEVKDGNTVLEKNKDYTVSGTNNRNVPEGTEKPPTVTVTGKDNYTGTDSKTFAITPIEVDTSKVVVSIADQAYTGEPIEAPVEVKYNNNTLIKDTDYTVTYANNTAIHNNEGDDAPKATITFINNFTSDSPVIQKFAIKHVAITADNISISGTHTYIGSPIEPEVVVTCKVNGKDVTLEKDTESKENDYAVAYSDNTNAGTATVKVTGHGIYAGTPVEKTFTISPKSIEEQEVTVDAIEAKTYTGSAIEPTVTAKYTPSEGVTIDLEQGSTGEEQDKKDYTLTFAKNVNVASGDDETVANRPTITIAGQGNYTGTKTVHFTINPKNVSEVTIADITAQTYTGSTITPEPAVTDGKTALKKSDDFAYSYDNNTNAATKDDETEANRPTVKITGQGNYTGTKSAYFTINPKDISGVTIADIDAQTYAGSAIEPKPAVTDESKTLTAGTDFAYSYSNNTDAGTATVTVTGKNNYSESKSKDFTINAKAVTAAMITDIADQEYKKGAAIEPTLTVKDGNTTLTGDNYTVAYSNNTDIHAATGDNAPTATITGKGNYKESASKTFAIVPIAIKATMIADIEAQTYKGEAIEPTVKVTDGEVLTLGTHYTVKYENNTKAGTAKAIITGTGIYSGEATKEFTISQADVDPETKITINIAPQTYTGAALTPTPEVICDGKTLDADDYTVTYDNNVNVSNGEGDNAPVATVKLKGNYVEKTKKKKFVIKARSITADEISVADITAQTYTGSAIDPGVTVTDSIRAKGEQTLTNNDYEVTYNNTNINAGTATATIAGKGNYTGTTTKDFTINPKDIDKVTATIGAKTYKGSAFTPEPTVTYGSMNLVKDTDFEITGYADNINAGEASVTIKGKGNYDPDTTKTVKFTINPKSIADVTIAAIEDKTYDGHAKTPEPAVKDGQTDLVKDKDFTYSYDKNTDAGTAKVIVTGTGNYSSSTNASKEFTINPKSIAGVVIAEIPVQSYTGSKIEPALTVTDPDVAETKKNLVAGTDYEAKYENNTDVSGVTDAKVTITGKNNYSSNTKKEATFIINYRDLKDVDVETIVPQSYTGKPIHPEPAVSVGETVLVKGTDYTLSYANETAVHDAEGNDAPTVTITADEHSDKYMGSKTVKFAIVKKNLKDCKIELQETATYTGQKLEPKIKVMNGTVEVPATDYDVAYANNVKAATDGAAEPPTVTVTAKEGSASYTGTGTQKFTINPRATKNNEAITVVGIPDQQYTEEEIKPELTIKDGETVLQKGTDYKVTYANNKTVNEGEDPSPCANVEFFGNYKDDRTVNFKIIRRQLSTDLIKVSSIEDQPYTGGEIHPEPVVKMGDITLVKGTDYTLSYANATDVHGATGEGAPTVTITAKEGSKKYAGSTSVNIAIVKKDLKNCKIELQETATYKGEELEPSIKVMNGTVEVPATDYDVAYTNNVKAATDGAAEPPTVTVTAKEGSASYTGTGTQKFTINPRATKNNDAITVVGIPDQQYTEEEIKPELTIMDDKTVLEKGTDYKVTYANNKTVNEGEDPSPCANVEFFGNYKDDRTVTFNIIRRQLSTDLIKVSSIEDQPYTGGEIHPEPVVKMGDITLVKGTDYTLSYANATDVHGATGEGAPTVTITAKEGSKKYAGSTSVNFAIVKKDLKDCTIELSGNMTYTGDPVEPTVTVKNENETVAPANYTVTFSNNTKAATDGATAPPTVTVTAKEGSTSYTGTGTKKFTISANGGNLTVAPITAKQYTGHAIEPKPEVKCGSKVLTEGTDYKITYSTNNTEVNGKSDPKPYAKVAFIGNYSGEQTVEFNIVPRALNTELVTVDPIDDRQFTGGNIEPLPVVKMGDITLTKDTDYTLSYSDNVKDVHAATGEGAPTVTITAKSGSTKYTGSTSVPFAIVKRNLNNCDVELQGATEYTGSPIEFTSIVLKNDAELVKTTQYDVKYSNNTNAGTATLTLTTKDSSTNYTGVYTKKFTITPKPLVDPVEAIPDQHYTEEAIEPELTVKDGDKVLTKGKDYTVEYGNNVNKGNAEDVNAPYAKIILCGNYSGEQTLKFTIGAAVIQSSMIADIADKLSTGEAITPEPVVEWNGKTLKKGTDYTVAYENNTAEGVATIKVTGMGNFDDTVTATKTFNIVNTVSISKASVKLSGSSFTYSGRAIRPSAKLSYDGESYPCKVSYGNNVNIGRAVAYVSASRFSGTATLYYKINPQPTKLKKASKGSKKITAKWASVSKKKQKLVTGYQVAVSPYSNFRAGVKYKTVKGWKKSSVTIKGLAKKKVYYVKVRTYKTGGGTYYSTWSNVKSVKTK